MSRKHFWELLLQGRVVRCYGGVLCKGEWVSGGVWGVYLDNLLVERGDLLAWGNRCYYERGGGERKEEELHYFETDNIFKRMHSIA